MDSDVLLFFDVLLGGEFLAVFEMRATSLRLGAFESSCAMWEWKKRGGSDLGVYK